MRGFVSDNAAPIHPKILQAIADANRDHAVAYGEDPWTKRAIEAFRNIFGKATEVYLACTGTGANVIALASVLRPFEAVICADSAHLNTDECGALERFSGSKILAVSARDGKLTPEGIAPLLQRPSEEHHVRPRAISISQATEFGTVYTLEEIRTLTDFAKKHDLIVHMDGARLANAVVALGCSLPAASVDAGIDILSFGGTKNGLMCAEATLFFNPHLHHGSARYVRKQATQLVSKMRYVAAQFEALLSDDLWHRNAAHANAMAKLLAQKLASIPTIRITRPVQSNAVFATMSREAIERVQRASLLLCLRRDVAGSALDDQLRYNGRRHRRIYTPSRARAARRLSLPSTRAILPRTIAVSDAMRARSCAALSSRTMYRLRL